MGAQARLRNSARVRSRHLSLCRSQRNSRRQSFGPNRSLRLAAKLVSCSGCQQLDPSATATRGHMLSRDRLIRTGGLLVVTALLAVACNTAAANKNSGLANTEWLLSIMDGSPIASGTNVTIGFGLAQASGFSGCNQYSAGYQTDGSRGLNFSAVAGTRMACEQAVMAFETKYYASLAQVARYALAGGNLSMLDRANNVLLTFAPAAPATVEGPWIATMVNNGQGAVSSVPAGVTGAMSFFANGTIEGFG